jgi:hypothetical protein
MRESAKVTHHLLAMWISQRVRLPIYAVAMNSFAEQALNVVGVGVSPDNVRFRETSHRGRILMTVD